MLEPFFTEAADLHQVEVAVGKVIEE